ncbi:tetratricopeptide repeat protein [Shewanella nanhaiensis]|uniref:SEL1-like repeat protein n=1 Tax=Shewanella nanhaiensis TaxID=2864872 RepID=A0ABS7E6H9_9GAMM|nr:tetratricopeptide repeat protein [Shewanella nanhaiensis]MBW8185286.1 SEL1-like repeat protein [Shewanella nanhaiensis]
MLTDVEFVARFSPELGQDYRVAKSYVTDVPTQALLQIRSLTHKLTELLALPMGITFDSPNLYDRIETLNSRRVINVRVTRAMHKLRGDGNRGAHPEKYHLTSEQLQQLSEKSIERVLSLIESLFVQVTGKSLPKYHFEAFDSLAGRDLCYRAVMESDPQAQYLVGMSLKTRALMQREQELALGDEHDEKGAELGSSSETLKQAEYWFGLASTSEMDARYEYGVAKIHGYSGEPDVIAGEEAIAQAAEAGVVNAMALLGYFYLVGGKSLAVDKNKALDYLQRAADLEQSEAMANLGVLYYQEGALTQAYQFIAKAAQAGFPHAQYHLALMLARGEGCEVDPLGSEQWMAEAAELGQVDAMFSRAQSMLNDDNAFGTDLSQAELYLREVIKYGHSVPAMIELSIALADGVLGRIDVVGSASLLKLAREHGNEHELSVISPLWHSLSQQVENVIAVTKNKAELVALKRAQEILA